VDGASQAKTISERFVTARRDATGFTDYPGDVPATLADGYAVQEQAIAIAGGTIAGWKVGRIMPPLSERFGTDRLAGPIFADSVGPEGSAGAIFADGFGAAEAEFLLRIGQAPAAGQTSFTLDEAADLIDAVHIGIEIASSPFTGINEHGPVATISDFGNNNGLIVGAAIADWRTRGLEDIEVTTRIDGELIKSGVASAFPDGLIGSVRFLIENLVGRGFAIEPGWWISSGAVTGVHPVRVGQTVEADFGPLGTVTCTIAASQPKG
jgi:2-keto-4-pentenoate hydratase